MTSDTNLSASEPLRELARFAFENADHTCAPEISCESFHKVFSLVRFYLMKGALPAGSEIYIHELRRLADLDRTRVLISGAADTGLFGAVCKAFDGREQCPEVTLVDICETPLAQNQIMAKSAAVPLETSQGDILEFSATPFDAILAHSFLNYFSDEGQEKLVENWSRLLAPGGSLIVINNLYDHENPLPRRTGATLAEKVNDLISAARADGWGEGDLTVLATAAKAFWHRPPTNPITRARLLSLLGDCGFEVVKETPLVAETGNGPLALTSTPAGRVRTALVCTRR